MRDHISVKSSDNFSVNEMVNCILLILNRFFFYELCVCVWFYFCTGATLLMWEIAIKYKNKT